MFFIWSVLASIVAGGIVALVRNRSRVRHALTTLLGHVLGTDLDYVYRHSKDASKDIAADLERAKFVDIMIAHGQSLVRDELGRVSDLQRLHRDRPIRLLLAMPHPSDTAGHNWTQQRELETARFDESFGSGLGQQQTKMVMQFLVPYIRKGVLQLRLFNAPYLGRIILTDRIAYFTPARKDTHGRDSAALRYRHRGDMYEWLQRYFEIIWDASDEYTPEPTEPQTAVVSEQ